MAPDFACLPHCINSVLESLVNLGMQATILKGVNGDYWLEDRV